MSHSRPRITILEFNHHTGPVTRPTGGSGPSRAGHRRDGHVKPDVCSRVFGELLELTEHLRSPDGCAWDRAQTIETLRPHLVEEFHEVLEALDHDDDAKVRDELGDLFFLIVFIARIAEEAERFDLEEIIRGIDSKLRRRHPHVFGEDRAETPDEVRSRWESGKLSEDTHRARRSILDGLPRDFSALLTARRMQEKAAAVGFDWKKIGDVIGKAEEELGARAGASYCFDGESDKADRRLNVQSKITK